MKRFFLAAIVALLAHMGLLAVPFRLPSPPVEPPPVLRFVIQDRPDRPILTTPGQIMASAVQDAPAPAHKTVSVRVETKRLSESETERIVENTQAKKPIVEQTVEKKWPKPPKQKPSNKPEPVARPVTKRLPVSAESEPEPAPRPRPEPEPEQTAQSAQAVQEVSASSGPEITAAPASPTLQALAAADSAPGEAILQAGPLVTSFGDLNGPRILRRVAPKYPPSARRRGEEGTVLLLLAIDEKGELDSARVLQSAGERLDDAALAAVRQAKYAPATNGGRPVACLAKLPIRFSLRSSP